MDLGNIRDLMRKTQATIADNGIVGNMGSMAQSMDHMKNESLINGIVGNMGNMAKSLEHMKNVSSFIVLKLWFSTGGSGTSSGP